MDVAEAEGEDLLRFGHRIFDCHSELIDLVRGVRVERSAGSFYQVPEHFVELPDNFERREHVFRCCRICFPADSLEEVLGDVLAGSEAVEDSTSPEAPRTQALVDGAGEIGGKVLAGSSCWFVDGEVRRAGKAEGGAAEREAVAAVRAQ